jgi:aryl-alcohol dehydrogenase-like predicted oxidoreductase
MSHQTKLQEAVDAVILERMHQVSRFNSTLSIEEGLNLLETMVRKAKNRHLRGSSESLDEVRQITTVGLALMQVHGIIRRGEPLPPDSSHQEEQHLTQGEIL